VGAAWKSISTTIKANKAGLQKKAEGSLGQVVDARTSVKDKVTAGISAVLNPAVSTSVGKVAPTLTSILLQPL
jgi:hypothetical protein